MDSNLLSFDLNRPAEISSVPLNTTNATFTPRPHQSDKSSPSSGKNRFRNFMVRFLKPSPRNQLNVPTNNTYSGNIDKFYKPVLNNANYVRGNEFGLSYPYPKQNRFIERILKETPQDPISSNNIDYIGNKENIQIRANSRFYPFPTQKYQKNKKYWTYPTIQQFLTGQPVYNYPHGKIEGARSNIVENFSGGTKINYNSYVAGFIIVLLFVGLCVGASKKK